MYPGERFNGFTHLAGAVLAPVAAAALIVPAALRGDALRIVSFCVYGATLCLLYAVSTLYHSTRGRAKRVLRKLDHVCIYLLIAGTYTPFGLLVLSVGWAVPVLTIVWTGVLTAILLKVFWSTQP
jgi:hemolysin III